ncbi:MAG: anthranilate synthase component I, partial [Vicinamibacterales bacterium]
MHTTSFEEFKERAGRGTFVPVVKEIVADLLTPVSAFLKIAEDADYAFLLESVEGGEHVGRYSFLGKDPFLILRARGERTILERGGRITESDEPFVETLRSLMADFRSPFVPDLPRFTGGAVGYLGYGAASWFEPVLGDLGTGSDGTDPAGFMLFDTILAFDHVRHR